MSKKEYRTYFGKRFYKDKKGYWTNSMSIFAHRWVWICHNGYLDSKFDVHHKDGNKDNNEIENLEALSRSDHLKIHWKQGSYDLQQRREQLSEARRWLKTPCGRKKQSELAKEGWIKRKSTVKFCLGCQGGFETLQPWAKCCCEACYMRYRRKMGLGRVERNCWICDKIFTIDKFSRTRTCGRECKIKFQSIIKVRNP